MSDNGIRHLPVLDGGELLGIITDRDLHLIQSLRTIDGNKDTVEDAMTQNAFAVSPDAPLDEVVTSMAEGKYGSAIVLQGGHLVGIFTTVDVCRALADLLHTRMR
jgi:acetoin utilization protein AcuB